ncbi:MAG: response regulator [Burkholderiaceae bacterium]
MPKKTTSAVDTPEAGKVKKLILIVDDEFDLTSTFSMLFQLNGFETFTANNGQHALELMNERIPDIILSDCMMPVMSGILLAQRVRANPATAQIPIILMSAIPQHQDLVDQLFNAFIQKPFQFRNMLELALRVLTPPGTEKSIS